MSNTTSNQSNDSTERYYADMESARNYHEHEYFKARPSVPNTAERRELFRAGFERAFKHLWQRFVDAEADMLRIHRQYVDLKYPGTGAADETTDCQHDWKPDYQKRPYDVCHKCWKIRSSENGSR